MKHPFRIHHLLTILSLYEKEGLPLDLFLRNYFRTHKQIGSKDRKEICQNIYDMVRKKGLIDHLTSKPHTWEKRLTTFQQINHSNYQVPSSIPLHIQLSFPKEYFELISNSFGEEKAIQICHILNEQAPTTIRVNSLKTTRNKLFASWEGEFPISLATRSENAIHFHEKINFFGLQEFKDGLFEIQDEGSQLISTLVQAKPKDLFLDYCAGSGGKSLAIAPQMEKQGQIFLHDIRPHALMEAKKRLKRADIQNAQLLFPNTKEKTLYKKMDWVLADVPCSGSGTLRRNPDMKWKFTLQMLENLVSEQQAIFENALLFLKNGGHIVYTTCSIFPEENEKQVALFLKKYPISLKKMTSWLPQSNSMDGFFGAVFQKIN